MKLKFRILFVVLIMILVISVGYNVVLAGNDAAEPGSAGDPIITKSYADAANAKLISQLTELQAKYDALVQELQKRVDVIEKKGPGTPKVFSTIYIDKGVQLITAEGTELILRDGKATALKGKTGLLLADISAAKDLTAGTSIIKNHLLVSAKEDGMGLKAVAKCTILIKGEFNLIPVEPATTPPTGNGTATGGTKGTTGGTPATSGTTTPAGTGSASQSGVASSTGTINASALNIRAQANTTSAIQGKAYKGSTVTVVSKSGEWYKIKTSDGVTGWVLSQYVTLKK